MQSPNQKSLQTSDFTIIIAIITSTIITIIVIIVIIIIIILIIIIAIITIITIFIATWTLVLEKADEVDLVGWLCADKP